MTLDKIKDIDKDINVNQHEVETFLSIFQSLMQTVNSEEGLDKPDRAVTNTILQIVLKISELIKNNIDSLKLPEMLKLALKKIKSLFNIQTEQNAEHANETEKANETAGNGVKNMENRRVRNRKYNVTRILAQPKNVEVKQNDRVVCRMVVRRSTIYPGSRRRNYY